MYQNHGIQFGVLIAIEINKTIKYNVIDFFSKYFENVFTDNFFINI